MKNRFYLIFLCYAATIYACQKNDEIPPVDNIFSFSETIMVDGIERSYILKLPPNYYDTSNFSLIIALHGGAGTAEQFELTSKLTEKANTSKFIVVYPEGIQRPNFPFQTWNAGECCGYAVENNINDIEFISRMIDKLVSKYDINFRKVYATGHSNGGMMAYRLACELSNKITAIAPNGCTMVTSTCEPERPVPILHMHSELDSDIPHQGGAGSGAGTNGIQLTAIESVLNIWSLTNSCNNVAEIVIENSGYKFTQWTNCNDNVSMHYYLTKDGGHGWPGGMPGTQNADDPSTEINANDLLWEFFQQFELP